MLRIENLDCQYGAIPALSGISLELRAGEVLCLMGRNGAGKTTLLRAIMGLMRASAGKIFLDGAELTALPAHAVPRLGIAYVPQGRRLFAELSVAENLRIGLMTRERGEEVLERALDLFPILRERLDQQSGTLSGGEQQMLATARALCVEPKVLLLDEPTEGLMPSMVERMVDAIAGLRRQGLATILVEQRIMPVMMLADRVAFLETGRLREIVTPDEIKSDPTLVKRYVGV